MKINGVTQLHIHSQIAHVTRTSTDGKWRAPDSLGYNEHIGAVAATVSRHLEEALTQRFGLEWTARDDGHGFEITGIRGEMTRLFSSRRESITKDLRGRAAQFEQHYGRKPSPRELAGSQGVVPGGRAGRLPAARHADAMAASCQRRPRELRDRPARSAGPLGRAVHRLLVRLRRVLPGHPGHPPSAHPGTDRGGRAQCRELGLDQVLLTCAADNESSHRVIPANDGIPDGRAADEDRFWIDLGSDHHP
jgi:hypothetical protein